MIGKETAEDGVDTRLLRDLVHSRLFDDGSVPPRLGRFVVEQRLGQGAMGIVYAAHDAELDRRVAIKLLSTPEAGEELTSRLRREAQAMARLAHPNVVAVFEVGTHAGAPFVAMELVDGSTLTRWLAEPGRTQAEVLAAFAAAGAGLAAAHEAGLVHRDFKPDNVLVGRDGRPRVGDFGLVRGLGGSAQAEGGAPRSSATHATHSSALAGTPAYMAPELFEGAVASTRSDQYAFCVALFEALFGARPHSAKSLAAMIDQRVHGEVTLPVSPRVPRALRRLLVRGLARDPASRYPDMRSLLAALERARRRPHRAWIGGAVLAASGIAIALWRGDDDPGCARGAQSISSGWDDEQRSRVEKAILDDGFGAEYSAATAERIAARLDAWTESWRETHEAACDAARTGAVTRELAARQMLCLDRRRLERDALVRAIADSHAPVTGRSLQAAAALASPSTCAEAETLIADVAPPREDIAAAVADVRSRLAEAKSTLDVASDADTSLALAHAAVERADEIGYSPVAAEARLRLAMAMIAKSDFTSAETMLERAYFDAIAADHELLALQTIASLVHTVGVRAARPDDALVWWNHGEALLRKLGAVPREASQLENSYSAVLVEQGKTTEALEVARRAIAHADEGYGPEHPSAVSPRQNLANAQLGLGLYADALAGYEDVIERLERLYGDDHPQVATALGNSALALDNLDRVEEALERQQRALAIFERTIGSSTIEVGYGHANIGNLHKQIGDHEAALASYQRAQQTLSSVVGPDDPRTCMLGGSIGWALLSLGRVEEARVALQTAIDGLERVAPRHPELPNNYDRLGLVEQAAGDCERSVQHHRHALELATELGLPQFSLAFQHMNIGVSLLCAGRPDDAIAELEQARATWIAEDAEVRAKQIASVDRSLAAARLDAGRPDALSSAEAVLRDCVPPTCGDEERADVLVLVAQARLAAGRTDDARDAADEALSIRDRVGGTAWARGDVRWVAAQARYADGVRGSELDDLLQRARTALREAGPRGAAMLATWPAWTRR